MKVNQILTERESQTKKCIVCGKEFTINKYYPKRKYCSGECKNKDNYLKNRKKVIERVMNWQRKNRDKYNKYKRKYFKEYTEKNKEWYRKKALESYYKNPIKWKCRKKTLYDLKKGYIKLENKCQDCGVGGKLFIHHEEYINDHKEIKRLVVEGKIYKLCRKCHGIKTRKVTTI